MAFAQTAGSEELRARRATVAPKIDGLLDDELWSTEPLQLDPWMSYNPLRGEPEQQQTKVWIGLRQQSDLLRLRCYDTEPDKIRSTISRRDNVWNDDWVGVSLDSSRAGQIAYHMFVNPSGIQMDALQSANEDTAARLAVAECRPSRRRRLHRRDPLAASEHQIPAAAATCGWAMLFFRRTAAWACRGRGPR